MSKRMSKFGSGILETLNPPSSDVYWVYVKSVDPKCDGDLGHRTK